MQQQPQREAITGDHTKASPMENRRCYIKNGRFFMPFFILRLSIFMFIFILPITHKNSIDIFPHCTHILYYIGLNNSVTYSCYLAVSTVGANIIRPKKYPLARHTERKGVALKSSVSHEFNQYINIVRLERNDIFSFFYLFFVKSLANGSDFGYNQNMKYRKGTKDMYDDSFKIRYTVAPIAVSETNAAIKGETPPHLHRETEILYIEKGNARVKIDKNEFFVKSGNIVFVNPMEVHSVEVENEENYRHKCVCFDTVLIADEKIRADIENGFLKMPYFSEDDDVLKKLFLKLFFAVKKNNEGMFFEISGCISLMFAHFLENKILIEKVTSKRDKSFCEKVTAYIEENYAKPITSKDIARSIGYTQSYFCRAFKKFFNLSFSEYLNMYRISVSKKVLENENARIADVACECGFESPIYFSRCFKKHIGMTPAEYKKCQYRY